MTSKHNISKDLNKAFSRCSRINLRQLMQKQIAELFGVNRVTINEWTKRHYCPRNSDESYDLFKVIQWWAKYIQRRHNKRNRERNLTSANRFFAENSEQIKESDKYIRELLSRQTVMEPKDIPDELVAVKRAQIKLKRAILEMQK